MTNETGTKGGPVLGALTKLFNRNNDQLPSSEDMINYRGPLVVGAVVIGFTFFGLGAWATFAQIDSAALAPGVVTVENNRRVVQHLEGGIIQDLLVREGSTVNAGDVLVRLDDIRARAQLGILRNNYNATQALEARLLAERNGAETLTFPKELLDRAQNHPEVPKILKSQRDIFEARKASIRGQISILNQRVGQFGEQIAGLQALEKSKETQIRLIKQELEGLRDLLKDGYVTITRVLALEREASRLEGERGDHLAGIARARQGIGEAEMQILQLQKTRAEEVTKELREVEGRLAETRERLLAAEDTFERIDVLAPVSGTVLNLAFHSPGGVIGPGEKILEIVPNEDKLVVEVRISPADIDSVHAGQDVALRVSTVDARFTPVIEGTLKSVSADSLSDPKSGAAYYRGVVTLGAEAIAELGDTTLQAGMPVEAQISRGQRSVLSYAVKPLTDSLARSFKEN